MLGYVILGLVLSLDLGLSSALSIDHPLSRKAAPAAERERLNINAGWRFSRFTTSPDSLTYNSLKQWILPSANDFIKGDKRARPAGTAREGG